MLVIIRAAEFIMSNNDETNNIVLIELDRVPFLLSNPLQRSLLLELMIAPITPQANKNDIITQNTISANFNNFL